MKADDLSIHRMTRSEMDVAIDWAATEGWNPGLHDADCFYEADPNGFLIGTLDNEPVAMVSAVAYGDVYGFMGFYIVKPDERNRGYGLKLWEEGLRYLGSRPIGLDSVRPDLVSAQKPQFKPAYTNYRFESIKDEQLDANAELTDLSLAPLSLLAAYDTEVFGFSREGFLKFWISRPGSRALGVVKNDKLLAYGVIRECREGFKIGPLFADNAEFARVLFRALTRDVGMGCPVYLDTPERNPGAMDIARSYNMREVFRTTRMYNQAEPTLSLDKWFGVTTYELG